MIFFKIIFLNIFNQTIPRVISTSLEKRFLFHLPVSLWQHYFVFRLFFFVSERYHYLFLFSSFFKIKLYNQSTKPHLVNCLQVIFAINFYCKAFKIKSFSKIYSIKKIKYFKGYGGLHMLRKLINRPSKYIFLLFQLLLMENISFDAFLNPQIS